MLYDNHKIETIKNKISEAFQSALTNSRCAKIVFDPCFKSLFLAAHTCNFLPTRCKCHSLDDILQNASNRRKKNLFARTIEKIVSVGLGIIPKVGKYLSVGILLSDVCKDVWETTNGNRIKQRLESRWKKRKKYRTVRHVIYIDHVLDLSEKEISVVQILAFLIQQKYITDTCILLAQSSEIPSDYLGEFDVLTEFKAEDILADGIDTGDREIKNHLTILNIVGINHIEQLNFIFGEKKRSDETISAIIQCMFNNKQIEETEDLKRFLNTCSLLFEQFNVDDVHFVANLQNDQNYHDLFLLAQKSEIIQSSPLNWQKFYFLQPFLREYYQRHVGILPANFYDEIYKYLEEKYPNAWDELAIASTLLLSDDDTILSANILAYYHCDCILPLSKLLKIKATLRRSELGGLLLELNELYKAAKYPQKKAVELCTRAIALLKFSHISTVAKLAALSFIARVYYDTDMEQEKFIALSDYYRHLLTDIQTFSNTNASNYNFALDFIAFSTCIEENFATHNAVQKLVNILKGTDAAFFSKEKYLKFLRLGNAIYPQSVEQAKSLLYEGYVLSKESHYLHALSTINYAVGLILEDDYHTAVDLLNDIVKENVYGNAVLLSAQNNYVVAIYLQGKISADKAIKLVKRFCDLSLQGDYYITINNYISFKIMSGAHLSTEEIRLCQALIGSNDRYHCFYATQNILTYYFLTKNDAFWKYADDITMPYLIKHYEPIFVEKLNFFKAHFGEDWQIERLSSSLLQHLKSHGFEEISHFNSLPVLFGLIERWFE